MAPLAAPSAAEFLVSVSRSMARKSRRRSELVMRSAQSWLASRSTYATIGLPMPTTCTSAMGTMSEKMLSGMRAAAPMSHPEMNMSRHASTEASTPSPRARARTQRYRRK